MSGGLYAYKKHFIIAGNNRRMSEVCNLKCIKDDQELI
jgi:hypothetical protein